MTPGEKRFSERLESKLEDDYLLWYDVPVGLKQRRPDFVVFHPRRGLLVLEVKDWKWDSIQRADRTQFTLITSRGLVKESNPLLQARAYALEIGVVLEADPALRHGANSRHAGKLVMPWAYGVVLANISRRQFIDGDLGAVIPDYLAICSDEIYNTVDAEAFQERLWAMFPQVFPVAMTLPQIDRMRWHLFPEIRVAAGEGQFGLFDSAGDTPGAMEIPDLIKVMDAQQEQLARSIGAEHRLIHGVAGSGKTMILGFRAMQLARELGKPILVLCYNKTLAARLEQLVGERGLSDKVQVYNFHRWCHKMLSAYHVDLPAHGTDFFTQMVERVIDGVERGQIPRFQYGAVLIDEGHDFEPDWYKLIVQMVDPQTNSLLILYDDAQNINGSTDRRKFTWKSLGVQAQGRTTILKLNYRNTLEILSVARSFAVELLRADAGEEDGVPLIAPESAGRRGAVPELLRADSTHAEMAMLVSHIRDEQARGRRLDDIGVLYRHNWQGAQLREVLEQANIASRLADTSAGKSALFLVNDAVKIISMHSSKGLEFPLVIIPALGQMPRAGEDESAEARLLYVAMTRATERLLLLHHVDSLFSKRIRASINEVQSQLQAIG